MRTLWIALAIITPLVGLLPPRAARAQAVRAVLFYSPTCPHCEQVINQDLPTFFRVYGGEPQVLVNDELPRPEQFLFLVTNGQLEILMVDASRPVGGALYQASFESHPTTGRRSGVPRLIVADEVLVGAIEIPSRLHGIIRAHLASGGTGWPAVAGLAEAVASIPLPATAAAEPAEPEPEPPAIATQPAQPPPEEPARAEPAADTARAPALTTPAEPTADSPAAAVPFEQIVERRFSFRERFLQDPVGNGLAILVLLGMIGSVLAVPLLAAARKTPGESGFAVPILAALGIVVAGYLSYIEASGATAICGPVGDCNAVQQSEYAVLFGIVPVGLLGLLGYIVIITAWLLAGVARGRTAERAAVALVGTAFLGTVFSIYLTFLEPFVIGATCAWCLTSAVLITLLLWLSAEPGIEAWSRLRHPASPG